MAKLPCPPELWPAFSALLDEALDIPEAGRNHWLASLGAEHAEVRPWLMKVLATDAATRETGLLKEWPKDGPRQLWKVDLSGGFSSVAVANGMVFTQSKEKNQEVVVCAIDDAAIAAQALGAMLSPSTTPTTGTTDTAPG